MATQPRTCADCSVALGRANQSGRCRRCLILNLAKDPAFQARRQAGIRRAFQANPERREEYAARARAIHKLPQAIEARRRGAIERRIWERGNAAQGPAGSPARVRAGKKGSAAKLAWCPPHLREHYRYLVYSQHVKAAEARALILEQHEAEMRRWRRAVGVEEPAKVDATPSKGVLFIDRASAVASAWAGVPDIWVKSRDQAVTRARWAVYLALRRGGWSVHRISVETGMERKGIHYALERAEVFAAAPGEFADLLRKVCAA
jgi:hypothetical protein